MRTSDRTAFSLVEILIVVVILGILAAIVVPQLSSAATESGKVTLRKQVQEIQNQIELYRTRHGGLLPTTNATSPLADGDWGILVSTNYLKEEPFNTYMGASDVSAATEAVAVAAVPGAGAGWYFEVINANRIGFYPGGFDMDTDLYSNE